MLTDTIRKMASVQKIASLTPIENSDFLEVAMMENLGWKVVVKKGEFKPGDIVVYFEIDSAIDVKDLLPCMEFLKERCLKKLFTSRTPETSAFSGEYIRIKTVKLRGQISQGLIVPIADIQEHFPGYTFPNIPDIADSVGADLTQQLKVEVWDRLVEWYEERSQLGTKAQSHAAGNFPSDVPKTDEERIQTAYSDLIKDPANVDGTWEVTIKNDGSSCTLFYRPMTWNPDTGKPAMQIASRRFLLKDDGGSDDWFEPFKRDIGWDTLRGRFETLYDIGLGAFKDEGGEWLLPPKHEIAIQGEIIGPKFNGNKDRNKETHFRVFRIFDITEQKFVTPKARYAICDHLGLEHVKVLETSQVFHKLKSVDDFLAYADGPSENGLAREGVVFKRVDDGSVSFKSVSNKYLLKQED